MTTATISVMIYSLYKKLRNQGVACHAGTRGIGTYHVTAFLSYHWLLLSRDTINELILFSLYNISLLGMRFLILNSNNFVRRAQC